MRLGSVHESWPARPGVATAARSVTGFAGESLAEAPSAGRPFGGVRLDEMFLASAAAHPSAVAVIAGDQQFTYRQVQQRAMTLAHHLRAAGVQPGELVGLCVRRSVDMVVGALGILIAGGAYVPLDPDYPADRLGYIFDDTGLKVLVSQTALGSRFSQRSIEMVYVDESPGEDAEDTDPATSLPKVDRHPLAYVIYTSGSTGHPKGVMITHAGAANTILDVNARFQVGPGDRALALSSLCFDLSVYDLFGLLAAGATVVIPDPERHFEPGHWAELIERHKVTLWNSVPAFMEMFLTQVGGEGVGCGSLRRVLLSGDWIPVSLPQRIRALAPQAEIISLGGATEVSIWSIYYPIDLVDPTWKSIPYGRPLTNQTVYVLGDDLRRCDVGVSGELYIGGDGVAVGYWNRPELNGEKFIPDPFSAEPGARLYRTGDLGRFLPDGDIEFVGRIDHQVKIRGFRIELEEIEAALVRHPQVAEAAVVARQSGSGSKSLMAFFVTRPPSAIGSRELSRFLRQRLPDYMIPARFIRIDRMPLNVNGKVDRTSLPLASAPVDPAEPEGARLLGDFAPPRDEIEAQLVRIWEDELGIRPIGVRDTFFELGGDSLTAVGVFVRIEREFRRGLPPTSLLERPTIEQLAELLRDPQFGRQTACLVKLQESGSGPPLICLPGLSGNLWECRRLAKRLGPDISLYGLQPAGLDGERAPHESIGEIAEHYLGELRVAQPTGPYYLAGYSFGGVVAYEMAQRLLATGETVALLALLDSPAGGFSWPTRLLQRLVFAAKVRLRSIANAGQSDHDPLEPIAWTRVSDVHRRALDRYVMKSYPGRLQIFRSMIRPAWPNRALRNHNRSWLKLAQQGGDVHLVPGSHFEMFRDGNIEVVAEKLRVCLLGAAAK
jgi:amino acid adenylation domain-containing protein